MITYNSLMGIDDMPGILRAAARVLKSGGRLVMRLAGRALLAGAGAALIWSLGGR